MAAEVNNAKIRISIMLFSVLLTVVALAGSAGQSLGQGQRPLGVPGPSQSKHIDQILGRGALIVGVIGEFPWLVENTTGAGEPFHGPSWTLAKEYAKRLHVRLQTVAVSHETKVPILATGQVDVTIAPLAETEQRKKVVEFITYTKSASCWFGLAKNPKLASKHAVEDLNDPNLTMAYFAGSPIEPTQQLLPKAKYVAVSGSGANAPVEEILSGRADIAGIDAVAWPQLHKAHPELISFPQPDSACIKSTYIAIDVGQAIDKGDPVFLKWLQGVEKDIDKQLQDEFEKIVAAGS